jgi:hypothetical protein
MGDCTIIKDKAAFEIAAQIFLDKLFNLNQRWKTILVISIFELFQMDNGRSNISVKPPKRPLKSLLIFVIPESMFISV